MTQQPVTPTHDPETSPLAPGEKASYGRVLRDQRKVILVAAGLVVADFWVLIQLSEWTLAGCIAGGIYKSIRAHNHVAVARRKLQRGDPPAFTLHST